MFQVLSGFLATLFLLQLHSTNGQRISAVLTPIIISEGGTFQACFTLSERPFGSDFVLSLTSTGEIEFGPFTDTLTFTDGTTQLEQCIDVTLAGVDNTFRQQNVVNVFMATTTFQGETSTLLLGQLFLTDLTMLPIGFDQPTYTFIEGEAAQVCVSVDGFIEGQIFLRTDLSFTAGTATQFSDYQVGSSMVTFDAETTNQMECATLSITLDSITEAPETLTVRITGGQTPLTIDTTRNTATITIIDIPTECDETLTIQDGTLDFSSRSDIGSTATYTCEDGFELVGGDQVRTCQTNGQWSGVAPECQRLDCGTLQPPANGILMFTMGTTTFGSVVVYQCDPGYELTGIGDALSRECQDTGMWSLVDPTCEPVECPVLPDPTNGQVATPNGRTFPNMAQYSCNLGFDVVGSPTRTCAANAQWSGIAPTCTPVECPVLPDPEDGQVVIPNGRTFTNMAQYSCNPGFDVVGSPTRTCQANEQWSGVAPTCSPVDCGPLDDPDDGTVTLQGTVFMNEATYSCNTGFNVVGESVRRCLASAMWSGSAPECELVDCGQNFGTLDNGDVDSEQGTTFGSQVEFMCGSGFTLLGNQFRECLEDGTWSGTVPTCEVIECPDLTLTLPPFTMITITRISPNADALLAEYECIPGYETRDGLQSFCDPSNEGTWSGEPPTCTIIDCGPPSMVTPGGVVVSTTTFGSIATYQCDQGYVLNPSDEASRMRTCQDDGSWFGPDPACERVDCGLLLDPRNGMVTLTSTDFLSEATYNCSGGFVLVGSESRTCGANGVWSGAEPVCQDIDECSLRTDNCDLQASCFNSEGSFDCICRNGFTGGGESCTDIDECMTESANNCDEDAVCLNSLGSFVCTCGDGFFGNGVECDEDCAVQLVFDGIGDCNQWIRMDTREKIDEINSFVQSTIAGGCGCNFAAGNVVGGSLFCPDQLPSTAAVYRSNLRGVDGLSCNRLTSILEMAIESTPVLSVLGNQMDLIRSCDVGVTSVDDSDFSCTISDESGGISIVVIAAAAGGGVLFALLLFICLVVLVVFRRKQREKRMDEARNFVDPKPLGKFNGRTLPHRPTEDSLGPNDHIYTTPNLYDAQNQAQTTSFSADADVIPRLGTLKSQKKNFIEQKADMANMKPVPVSIPTPGGTPQAEEFYDRVFDDGYDRPRSMNIELRGAGGKKPVYEDGYDRPRSIATDLQNRETPLSTSLKAQSMSNIEVTDEVQAINVFAGTTIPRSSRDSRELSSNPLYNPHM